MYIKYAMNTDTFNDAVAKSSPRSFLKKNQNNLYIYIYIYIYIYMYIYVCICIYYNTTSYRSLPVLDTLVMYYAPLKQLYLDIVCFVNFELVPLQLLLIIAMVLGQYNSLISTTQNYNVTNPT